jgi:hypothetical protein
VLCPVLCILIAVFTGLSRGTAGNLRGLAGVSMEK